MKKTTTIIIFLLAAVFCFAETGHEGISWGCKRDLLDFGQNAETWKTGEDELVFYGTNKLGRPTIKTCFFISGEFKGASYYFLTEDTEELLQRFQDKKKIYEIQTQTDITQEVNGFIEFNVEDYPEFAKRGETELYAFVLVLGEACAYSLCNTIEDEGYKKIEADPEANGKVYIYDYNDDTRVYIITNAYGGLGFVTYLQHFKDY